MEGFNIKKHPLTYLHKASLHSTPCKWSRKAWLLSFYQAHANWRMVKSSFEEELMGIRKYLMPYDSHFMTKLMIGRVEWSVFPVSFASKETAPVYPHYSATFNAMMLQFLVRGS